MEDLLEFSPRIKKLKQCIIYYSVAIQRAHLFADSFIQHIFRGLITCHFLVDLEITENSTDNKDSGRRFKHYIKFKH